MEPGAASPGICQARQHARRQRRYERPLYRLFRRDIRTLNIRGDYLEMGAGSGLLAAMLAEDAIATSITAVDISADDVVVCSEFVRERGLASRVRCLAGDVLDEDLMQGLGQFDLVYSTLALHHWRDPARAVGQLWGAVKEGGALYICDFRRVWWARFLRFKGKGIHFEGALTPAMIGTVFREEGIANFRIRTRFFILQSVTAWK